MNTKSLKKKVRSLMRKSLNKKNRDRLHCTDFTILSSNCVGGMMSYELGIRFNSPTVNMYFETSDFTKFLKNLRHYLDCDWADITKSEDPYPIALIDDIKVYCVHYRSVEEAKTKWDERKMRINYERLFVIAIERDGCTYEDIREFDGLEDYKYKVIFTRKEMPEIDSAYYIKGSEQDGVVRDICQYKSAFSGRRWLDDFDYVSFLNQV